MSTSTEFTHNLIKGKIAETIFAQMFRESRQFTVLEFGYEKIIPELIQQGYSQDNPTVNILRTAPDFAVIDHATSEVRLIEVKYQKQLSPEYVLIDAKRMAKSWNPSWLFIATLDGFYFDEVRNIIAITGVMPVFTHPQIGSDTQAKYLRILKDFEQGQ
ncbi:MAG: hypothetical protein H6760_02545 [Candidatus Nomurabacteria bacterium]|nr:MAG: hypothetical protein H6760_02545 [Candidatus Nomurabacteria bacterium]